jgi:hypothetical protein
MMLYKQIIMQCQTKGEMLLTLYWKNMEASSHGLF